MCRFRHLLTLTLLCLFPPGPPAARADDELQFKLAPTLPLSDRLSLIGELGLNTSAEEDFATMHVGFPGASWKANDWLQFRGLLSTRFNAEEDGPDSLELRPSLGFKVTAPNLHRFHLYNLTRWEHRAVQDRDEGDWERFNRVRSRIGVEAPLTGPGRRWQPGTWYALADLEPFYQVDKHLVSPVNTRAGIGRVLKGGARLEAAWVVQRTRSDTDSPLEETGGMLQITVKPALRAGMFRPGPNEGD